MVIKVVLVDDHKLVRQGIRSLLESESDIRVVGEAGDGLQALGLIGNLRPDVLVVDLMMPGMSGIDVIRRISEVSPETKSVVLSMYGDEVWVIGALEAGASGYVLKDTTAEDLVRAIRAAVTGQRFLSPPLSMEKIERYGLHPWGWTDRVRRVRQVTPGSG